MNKDDTVLILNLSKIGSKWDWTIQQVTDEGTKLVAQNMHPSRQYNHKTNAVHALITKAHQILIPAIA